MKKKEKNNYIKLSILLIGTILLTIIICNIYRNYDGNKSNKSYIAKHVSTISYNELPNAITELSSNSFIYLSYTGNKDIYNTEKKIRKILKQYNLEDSFIYVDCSYNIDGKMQIKSLTEIFNVGKNNNITLPAIIYFKDNEAIDYIDSSESLIKSGDFSQLLDKYEIEKENT